MKKTTYFMILFSLLFIPLLAHSDPFTTTIPDNNEYGYWGGHVVHAGATAYGDVIGYPDFSVTQMVVTQTGNTWTVAISGNYFLCRQSSSCDNGMASLLGPGDLYISTANINPPTGPSSSTDTFSLSEGWNYVVPVTGTPGLYALSPNVPITMTNVSPLDPNYYIYRSDQAWRGGASGSNLDDTASYAFSGDTLTFTFDASQLPITDTMAFHWAMQCGNDVVEGQVPAHDPPPVPEPSTLLLLGSGLTCVVAYRKIRS